MSRSKRLRERGIADKQGYICHKCLGEGELSQIVADSDSNDTCSICQEQNPSESLINLANMLLEAIEFEYEDPANSVGFESREGGYYIKPIPTRELLFDKYEIDGETLDLLCHIIIQEYWVKKHPYNDWEDDKMMDEWQVFSEFVKHKYRYYLNSLDHDPLDRNSTVFKHNPNLILEKFAQFVFEHDLDKKLPANTRVYRGRKERAGENHSTMNELGPPPPEKAKYSNRMSPAGISMFYGGLEIELCLSELRQMESELIVKISVWDTTKELLLLNLTNLPNLPSDFDEEGRLYKREIIFLHRFAEEISKPIVKDGNEHIEYIPTQVLTDFFRTLHFRHEGHQPFHGIVYESSTNSGECLVLFCGPEGCVDSEQDIEDNHMLLFHPELVEKHEVTYDVEMTHHRISLY